jgi:NAD(P)H-hydrate epimerase
MNTTMQKLLDAAPARALDAEARNNWGLDPFALVEAAGRACAEVFAARCPAFFSDGRTPRLAVLAGSGNNAADAMVMLRALIFSDRAAASSSVLVISKLPEAGDYTPRSQACRSLKALGVRFLTDSSEAALSAVLAGCDGIIDGIAGTGLTGPLAGVYAAWAGTLAALRESGGAASREPPAPVIISIDVPSGLFDLWHSGDPLVTADLTLAIEPLKTALFKPVARSRCGEILPVRGIFPPALLAGLSGADEVNWKAARQFIAPVKKDDYKYTRGLVEIHAGAKSSAGAACIAARGAQAAGAGLVRLFVDAGIYPLAAQVLGVCAAGIMVAEERDARGGGADDADSDAGRYRFRPDAMLLGPGWGRDKRRLDILEAAFEREAGGLALVLDADAIALSRGHVFHGNALLTPHIGEFCAFTGYDKRDVLDNPLPPLRETAAKINACIILKSHVLFIAAPDGRHGILDGMHPVLATGGSGDLLAGICAALCARRNAAPFDAYTAALCASALLEETAREAEKTRRFLDPLDLAPITAAIAGKAWL